MAHRHRQRRRRPGRSSAGKPDESGSDPVRHPTAGRRRQLGDQHRRARSISTLARRSRTRSSWRSSSRCCRPTGRTRATTRRPMSPRRRSAPASPAPGGSSCRSRSARSSATSSCVALSTHLPDLSTAVPGDVRRSGSGQVQPVLLRRRRRRHRHPHPQPRPTRRWRARRGHRHRDVVLRPVVGRLGRPDALRLQPRRRGPRIRLAQEGLAPLPDAGQRPDGDRRRGVAASPSPPSSSARARRSSSSPPSARSSCTPRTGSCIYLGATTRSGSRNGSGAWAAGPSRSPGSPSPGSSC